MRKFFLMITVFVFASPIYSQFNIAHGTNANERGYSVRTTPFDDGYIIAGEMFVGPINNRDAILVKTDADGNLVWQFQYGWNGGEVFNSVRYNRSVPPQGFFCLGTTNSVGAGTNDILFMRINPNGAPISVRTYGGPLGDEGHCLQVIEDSETNDWGLIMVGETDNASSSVDMQILKTDLDGNINNSVVISNPGVQRGFWIEQTSDGGFIAVGLSSYGCAWGVQPFNDDIFVVKLEANLNVTWARTYGGSETLYKDDVAYSVKETSNGYVVTGRTESYGISNRNDVFVMNLAYDGTCTQFRAYGLPDNDEGFDILCVEGMGYNYDYIVTGFTVVDSVPYALLFTLNNSGFVQWSKAYGLGWVEKSFELDFIPDNGFVFAGIENSFGAGQFDVYHVEVDQNGFSDCEPCEHQIDIEMTGAEPCVIEDFEISKFEDVGTFNIGREAQQFETTPCGIGFKEARTESNTIRDLSEGQFSLYPNPTGNELTLNIPEEYYKGTIQIQNEKGQLIFEGTIEGESIMKLSTNDFSAGIYIVTIINEIGKSNSYKFLKIED